MDNLRKYDEIFMDVFSVEKTQLNESFNKENVAEWDSIHQLNLITCIEDSFDVMFGTDDALSLISYNSGIEILTSKYNINF